MKNRKHHGILSIILAVAIFVGVAAGTATGIPLANAETGSPRMFVSRESWEACYARYEVYGLGYDETNGTITYNGQVVRYFEDMWPVGEQGKAGTCFMDEGGTVDVYGVREYPEYIRRNPDGSFDPSGILKGLREATREEYDERTARMKAQPLAQGAVTEIIDMYQVTDTTVVNKGGAYGAVMQQPDVVWWTAEEFRAWMEKQRVAMQELVNEGARGWTQSDGWFVWTQAKLEEAMALYADILAQIEQGAYVSRSVNGLTDVGLMQATDDAVLSTDETVRFVTSIDTRMEEWRHAIAPYAPFGMSAVLDTAEDLVRLYWNGQEVRGLFDAQRGVWITDHSGLGCYPEGAKELIAVYEGGRLVGLRLANDEESALWDYLRGSNE